jgi:L-iditol 2-dehydrogenase
MLPENTKAVVFEEKNRVSIKKIPLRSLKNGEVLLEVIFCSICGSDLRMLKYGHRRVKFPVIPGHEVLGKIIHSKNKKFSEGDYVLVHPRIVCGECFYCKKGDLIHCSNTRSIGFDIPGGFSEFLILPEYAVYGGNIIKVEKPDKNYTLSEPLACVMRVYREGLPDGDVSIIGDGPIAFMHAFFLKANGIKARIFGKNKWRINFFRIKNFEMCEEEIPESSDFVVICASNYSALEKGMGMIRKGGTIIAFSGIDGRVKNSKVILNSIHYKELKIIGYHASIPEDMPSAINFIEKFPSIGELITHEFSLEKFLEGMDILKRRKAMKVIITPGGKR